MVNGTGSWGIQSVARGAVGTSTFGGSERCRCDFVEAANVDEAEPPVTTRAAIWVAAVRNGQEG